MDEIWEKAIQTALGGLTDHAAVRSLTLDSAVKCAQGRLPPPSLLEKFQNLEHLSIANVGVSSLEQFPRLQNLQKLILSDNRISGGLEFLFEAGLGSLRDLDLSNNRIRYIEDLSPLARLKLVSLDLYECPVTRIKDYRSRVFGLIKSLRYLDKMDADENERPESDDEDEDEDEDEDDPGSCEISTEDRPYRVRNGHSELVEEILDVDDDEESDADEEETATGKHENGLSHHGNGFPDFRLVAANGEDDGEDDDDGDEDDDETGFLSGEEIDEEERFGNRVYGHGIPDSDDDEDGVEDEDDDDDESKDEDDEEVDNEEGDFVEPVSNGRLTSTEGEIDGHEQGEDDDEDDDGETGEEDEGVEDDVEFEDEDEEDEDGGAGYLVQPVGQPEVHDGEAGDDDDEEEINDHEVRTMPTSSSPLKRKRKDDSSNDEEEGPHKKK